MQEDLSISEFEALVTTRVLSRLLTDAQSKTLTETLPVEDMAFKFSVAANGVLKDYGMYVILTAIYRRGRTYIIFRPTGRISCEICMDGLYRNGRIRRPKALLMSKRGYIRSKSLRAMAEFTSSLGNTKYSRGGQNGKNYQR